VAALVLSVLEPPPVIQNPIPVPYACGTAKERTNPPAFPAADAGGTGIVSTNPVAELQVGALERL
jgi:hypothetical protein